MRSTYLTTLHHLVTDIQPSELLCVGVDAHTELAEYIRHQQCHVVCEQKIERLMEEMGVVRRADLAYVAGALESVPKTLGAQLLARLRDLLAHRVLIRMPASEDDRWHGSDLIALGFSELDLKDAVADRPRLFEFNIQNYKTTPDWFNAEHWAHPHLWRP